VPIDPDLLAAFAADFAKGMTSIRGRRVQRLLKREFKGVDHVLLVQVGAGANAALGLSQGGATFCATDGRGRHASVVTWPPGGRSGLETRFDLHKDSLPVLGTDSFALSQLRTEIRRALSAARVPPDARRLASELLREPT
jgi:hypothetical protein